jgi:soluble lytic murein transglycosylase-like protein
LSTLQSIASQYGSQILLNSVGTDVSPALVLALISVESSGKLEAVSSAGATGLMLLMPDTAERFGVTDASDPAENIKGGVAYLAWLMEHFDNDPILALAGYNAGEGAVRQNGGVPPYAETRDYVPKVIAAWNVARALCLTPPELMSDGCVFSF